MHEKIDKRNVSLCLSNGGRWSYEFMIYIYKNLKIGLVGQSSKRSMDMANLLLRNNLGRGDSHSKYLFLEIHKF